MNTSSACRQHECAYPHDFSAPGHCELPSGRPNPSSNEFLQASQLLHLCEPLNCGPPMLIAREFAHSNLTSKLCVPTCAVTAQKTQESPRPQSSRLGKPTHRDCQLHEGAGVVSALVPCLSQDAKDALLSAHDTILGALTCKGGAPASSSCTLSLRKLSQPAPHVPGHKQDSGPKRQSSREAFC